MCNSRDENRRSRVACLKESSSFSAPAFPGAGFRRRALSLPDKPAGAIFGNGRKQGSGKTSSKVCLRNSRQLTRSIGIAPWWTAPPYVLLAEAQKPAQILRIG